MLIQEKVTAEIYSARAARSGRLRRDMLRLRRVRSCRARCRLSRPQTCWEVLAGVLGSALHPGTSLRSSMVEAALLKEAETAGTGDRPAKQRKPGSAKRPNGSLAVPASGAQNPRFRTLLQSVEHHAAR